MYRLRIIKANGTIIGTTFESAWCALTLANEAMLTDSYSATVWYHTRDLVLLVSAATQPGALYCCVDRADLQRRLDVLNMEV